MKESVRQRARELGFDDCRFTSATAPESAPQFQQWLAERRHGEMGYLERNAPRRIDPQQVLPGARSIITIAASYGQTTKDDGRERESDEFGGDSGDHELPSIPHPSPTTHHCGIVARYARHADYHHVLGNQLKLLTVFVNERGGAGTRSLWYVDTGPILERDLAQRSGLGFIGKHANLISRRLGNWILLSEILTTLEFEPDEPEKNRCGSCTRCISACPTGAITGPFQLDARLCISYLTIELKGSIPEPLRPAIGNRIYGCDDCLAVCPWNRFAREGELMSKHRRPDLAAPALVELLALDDAGFKQRFAGTPMLRSRRRGLLRNVCVALGNIADPTALPALQKAAGDPEPIIAEHATWAMARIQAQTTPAPAAAP